MEVRRYPVAGTRRLAKERGLGLWLVTVPVVSPT